MKILALDTATASCSVALWDDGRIAASERVGMARGHAEALAPMIARVRDAAGLGFDALDRLAVTHGPGHFTGLRAGLAAARGLALALARPLIGVTTLEAVAAGAPTQERAGDVTLVVALDSKRADAYVQAFDRELNALTPPQARPPADFAAETVARFGAARRYVVLGDAGDQVVAALRASGADARGSAAPPLPDAALVAGLAARAPIPLGPPAPLYLHPVETTSPRRRPPGRAAS